MIGRPRDPPDARQKLFHDNAARIYRIGA